MAEPYYYHNSYCYNNYGECNYHQSESSGHHSFFGQSNDQCYSYDSCAFAPQVAYSEFTPSKPHHYVDYDPYIHHVPAQTQFLISYSVSSEFNLPVFEEYDPTPYGGGYDLAETYGKPLPPSDKTCYPKSQSDPDPAHLNDFTFGSVKPPYEPQAQDRTVGSNNTNKGADNKVVESHAEPQPVDDSKEDDVPEAGSGSSGIKRRVNQVPSGYGLEAFDICESLFGYWPCLDRMKRLSAQKSGSHDEWRSDDPWSGTADYLFGMSNPYGEHWDRDGNYQSALYAYACQKQYQEQPLFAHVEYEDGASWL